MGPSCTFCHGLEFYGAPQRLRVTANTERCILALRGILCIDGGAVLVQERENGFTAPLSSDVAIHTCEHLGLALFRVSNR